MARSASSKPAATQVFPASNLAEKPASKAAKRKDDYSSEGVEDNDVFLLPGSDFQLVVGITVLAAIVRLFRIYQPTSVVFDEVQYVIIGGYFWLRVSGTDHNIEQLRRLCFQIHQRPILHGRTPPARETHDHAFRLARGI
jgi:hypothetical protein